MGEGGRYEVENEDCISLASIWLFFYGMLSGDIGMKTKFSVGLSGLAFFLLSQAAFAADGPPPIDSGSVAWILASSAFVLLMTVPGLALFYAGMGQQKNVLGTIMQTLVSLGIVTVVWVLWGYSLAFGNDIGHLIGGLDYIGLGGLALPGSAEAANAVMGLGIPDLLYMVFQLMFAAITVAIISGSITERVKFTGWVAFLVLWITIVYAPVAHWVWGAEGWLFKMGALDFAGGTVVHIASGVSGLAAALFLGKRMNYGKTIQPPHNLTLTLLGGGMLWFGWMGFNGGSALAANASAALAFVNTQIAAAAGLMGWMMMEWKSSGKPTMLGAISGAVAGLVVITPAAGLVSPMGALAMGLIGGVLLYGAVLLKRKLNYDDSLDAFGIHGIGGTIGAILTGVFVTKAVTGATGASGLLEGNAAQVLTQLTAVGAVIIYSFAATLLICYLAEKTFGFRLGEEGQMEGLDLSQHGETAYNLSAVAGYSQAEGEGGQAKVTAPLPKVKYSTQ